LTGQRLELLVFFISIDGLVDERLEFCLASDALPSVAIPTKWKITT
jgi:hypothetical protein